MITDDQQSIFKRCHSDTFPRVFTYKMAAKINWYAYRYGTNYVTVTHRRRSRGGAQAPPMTGGHHALWAPNSDTSGP